MSSMGHKRTLNAVHPMSALPPKADLSERDQHVRFVPEADIHSLLFDHLVSNRKQAWRYREAQCLSGLEVHHELEFGRLNDW